jgi:hypothetical protein
MWSRIQTVSIITRLWTGQPGFNPQQGEYFFFTTACIAALEPTYPPIQWVSEVTSLGVNQPELEGNHSPPSSVEVKNTWSSTSAPPHVFMTWYLLKHRDNFSLPFFTSGNTKCRSLNVIQSSVLQKCLYFDLMTTNSVQE